MLPELAESEARGEIADIYAEIRHFCAVPYVSSLQRHLATRPGWLPWCWKIVRPLFAGGLAQERAWAAAAGVEAPALPLVPAPVQTLWGLDDDSRAQIRNISELFVRVSPQNLVFSGIIRPILRGASPGGSSPEANAWQPPQAVPAPPPMAANGGGGDALSQALDSFSVMVDGHPFVPGLYRMLANYPAFLGYLSTTLAPRMQAPDMLAACEAVLRAVDGATEAIAREHVASVDRAAMPDEAEWPGVLTAIERYRETSPQMVVCGRMIGDCLG